MNDPCISGAYNIEVFCEGSPINGSPFTCKVFDSSAIVVSNVSSGMVGKPVEFKGQFSSTDKFGISININLEQSHEDGLNSRCTFHLRYDMWQPMRKYLTNIMKHMFFEFLIFFSFANHSDTITH